MLLISPCYLEKKVNSTVMTKTCLCTCGQIQRHNSQWKSWLGYCSLNLPYHKTRFAPSNPYESLTTSLLWWIYMHWMIQKTSELTRMECGNVMVLLLRMLASMGIQLMLKYFVTRIWAFTRIIIKFHVPTIAIPAHLISGV